jgi:Na+(H+)/acetate symporter ActP
MVLGLRARLARWGLGAAGAFFAISLIFWVRGAFGIFFVSLVAAACLGIALRAKDETARVALLFFATQLALSVYSRGDYLFEDYVDGQMSDGKPTASDVQHMADAIGGPYWFWGLVCAAFSAAVLLVAAWLYVKEPSRRRNSAP